MRNSDIEVLKEQSELNPESWRIQSCLESVPKIIIIIIFNKNTLNVTKGIKEVRRSLKSSSCEESIPRTITIQSYKEALNPVHTFFTILSV